MLFEGGECELRHCPAQVKDFKRCNLLLSKKGLPGLTVSLTSYKILCPVFDDCKVTEESFLQNKKLKKWYSSGTLESITNWFANF